MKKLVAFLSFIIIAAMSFSQTDNDDDGTQIGITEHLNSILPASVKAVNEQGDTVSLRSLIDKPTILNLVYYRCPGICTPVMDGIADMVSQSDLKIGKDYQIFTLSFDPREGIDLAINKKKNYLKLIKKENTKEGWKFFVADSTNIANITQFFGFKYKRTGNDYLHAAAIAVLSPQGKLTRYHYGTFYQPFEVRMSIIEANKGQAQPTVNRILQYCFKYDTQGKKYVLSVTRVSAAFIFIMALSIFLFLVIKPSRTKQKAK